MSDAKPLYEPLGDDEPVGRFEAGLAWDAAAARLVFARTVPHPLED